MKKLFITLSLFALLSVGTYTFWPSKDTSDNYNAYYFSTIEEATEYVDSAIIEGDAEAILKYANTSNVPEKTLDFLPRGLNRFLETVSNMEQTSTHSLSDSEYLEYQQVYRESLEPMFQKLHDMTPPPRWNIKPEYYLVYNYATMGADDTVDSTFDLTVGLFKTPKGWQLATQY